MGESTQPAADEVYSGMIPAEEIPEEPEEDKYAGFAPIKTDDKDVSPD